jgi:hypothetical protein
MERWSHELLHELDLTSVLTHHSPHFRKGYRWPGVLSVGLPEFCREPIVSDGGLPHLEHRPFSEEQSCSGPLSSA